MIGAVDPDLSWRLPDPAQPMVVARAEGAPPGKDMLLGGPLSSLETVLPELGVVVMHTPGMMHFPPDVTLFRDTELARAVADSRLCGLISPAQIGVVRLLRDRPDLMRAIMDPVAPGMEQATLRDRVLPALREAQMLAGAVPIVARPPGCLREPQPYEIELGVVHARFGPSEPCHVIGLTLGNSLSVNFTRAFAQMDQSGPAGRPVTLALLAHTHPILMASREDGAPLANVARLSLPDVQLAADRARRMAGIAWASASMHVYGTDLLTGTVFGVCARAEPGGPITLDHAHLGAPTVSDATALVWDGVGLHARPGAAVLPPGSAIGTAAAYAALYDAREDQDYIAEMARRLS